MRRQAGFSLLEVLAALALLAFLLAGVYSGVRSATSSVRAGNRAIERLDQIRAAQQLLQRELAQAMALPIGHTDQGDNLFFAGTARQLRYVAPLPGYLGKHGPQLQQFSLRRASDGSWDLLAQFALLPPDGGPPQALGQPEVLLNGIRAGSFSYRGRDAEGQPGPWQAQWPDGRLLPSLVRVELQLSGRDRWPTLEVPLRVDPSANQGPVDLLRGLRRTGAAR